MKKISVLLIIALMLCACAQGVSSASQSSSTSSQNSSSAPQQQGEEIVLIEENGNLVATTKTGIAQLYLQEKISEQCFDYLINFTSGADIYTKLKIEDYKIIYNEEKYKADYSFGMQYKIIKSENPKFPNGSKTDIVQDIAQIYIEDKDFVFIPKEIENETAVKMLEAWFGTYKMFPALYGKTYDYGEISNYLTGYYGKNLTLTLDEFKQLASDKFGVEKHEPDEFELFVKPDGTVEQGGMGGWASYSFVSCTQDVKTGDSLVRVQFYADASGRIPAQLVEYRIDAKQERFIENETLEYQSGSPLGMIANYTGYSVKFTDLKYYYDYIMSKSGDLTEYKLADAFINNDYAALQKELIGTEDSEITKQYSKIRVNSDNYTIYAESNSSNGIIVDVEIEEGFGSDFNVGRKSYRMGVGYFSSYITPVNTINKPRSIAQQWVKIFLSTLNVPDIMKMPTGKEINIEEFIISRLEYKFPGVKAFTAEQITQYAVKYLGIDDFKISEKAYTENGKYRIAPKGGCNTQNKILSVEGTRESPEITVQFYADSNQIVNSHVIKYTLKLLDGEYALKNIEVIEKSNIAPLRWCV